jgi:hypothetical protein
MMNLAKFDLSAVLRSSHLFPRLMHGYSTCGNDHSFLLTLVRIFAVLAFALAFEVTDELHAAQETKMVRSQSCFWCVRPTHL